MLRALINNWWVILLRGICSILFGIAAFIWPGPTLESLVLLFGVYMLADGVLAVRVGIQQYGERERWWMVLLEGIVGIVLGLLALFWPGATAAVLLSFVAAWALLTGAFEIAAALRLRKLIAGEWSLIVAGALSMLLGVLVFLQPGASALAIAWMIGAYAIVCGALAITLAIRLRGMRHAIDQVLLDAA